MKHLHVNPKLLTLFLLFLVLLPSCNNEEIFIVEESAIIAEETEPTAEDTPNNEDVAPPIDAVDDTVITMQNVPVDIAAYLNDTNLPQSITLSNTNPSNGVLTINNNDTPDNFIDDTVVYTPNAGFSGNDSFDYTICDATNPENCDTATVTITINPIDPIEDDIATELKAFPSAYGAGAYTTGGRGGQVIHVTNLNNSGAGSFREALSTSGSRTIVFDVAGVITLTSAISVTSGNLTIAGQTAPDGGITIAGYQVYFDNNFNNAIIRYIRFRGGSNDKDSVSTYGVSNVIFDHCSFSFGEDEAFSLTADSGHSPTTNITIQRCFLAESKTGMIIGGLNDNYAGGGDISVIHNLSYNINHRFPNASGNGNYDVINNVTYHVKNRMVRGNGSFNLLHIGNYYDYNNNSLLDTKINFYMYESGYFPTIYTTGNKITRGSSGSPLTFTQSEMNANNKLSWKYFLEVNAGAFGSKVRGNQLEDDYFTETQRALLGSSFAILTADVAFTDVTSNVGANARLDANGNVIANKDGYDTDWLAKVIAGTVTDKLVAPYNVSSFTGGSAYEDTDRDGMPDIWENTKFGNLSQDGKGDTDGDGYTDLEEFLNLVDSN